MITRFLFHSASVSLEADFTHLLNWSKENKLNVNISKTKEIVFHRPRLSKVIPHMFYLHHFLAFIYLFIYHDIQSG